MIYLKMYVIIDGLTKSFGILTQKNRLKFGQKNLFNTIL